MVIDNCFLSPQEARKKAEAKTRFEKNQEAVLRVYESGPIQALAASLIVAVLSRLRKS